MSPKIISRKGIEHIRDNLDRIAMRIKRDGKWVNLWLTELTPKEILDTILLWDEQKRKIPKSSIAIGKSKNLCVKCGKPAIANSQYESIFNELCQYCYDSRMLNHWCFFTKDFVDSCFMEKPSLSCNFYCQCHVKKDINGDDIR